MTGRLVARAGISLAAVVTAVWLAWPTAPPSPPRQPDAPSARAPAPDLAESPADRTEADAPEPDGSVASREVQSVREAAANAAPDREDHREHDPDPTGDLAFYEERPMSQVPHRVVRGWGARGSGWLPGAVGVFVVVDPRLSDEDLERLARDIRRYHSDATALSVRILDSEEAATYKRHSDGGALAAEHLVARVSRNEQLETDRIEIRSRIIDPDEPF